MEDSNRKHRADVVIEIKKGAPFVTKNRFGNEGDVISPLFFTEAMLKAPYDQTLYFISDERALAASLEQTKSVGLTGVAMLIQQTLDVLTSCGQGNRELSLVRTKLDEARLWLKEVQK